MLRSLSLLAMLSLVYAGSIPRSQRRSEWVECQPGTLNLILSSPHGGYEKPDHIPDRDAGCYTDGECVYSHDCGDKDFDQCSVTTSQDVNTQELTRRIHDELYAIYGEYPTMMINLLHRSKFDANREIDEATFGVPEVEDAFYAYHECIDQAKADISSRGDGMGLFLDIHGHGHDNDWAELGYTLSGSDLDNDDFEMEDTSILNLGEYTKDDHLFDDLLRGDVSYGFYLEAEGYESVPSPTNRGPDGQSYFSGGYNTKRHGSKAGGTIDAIQIESARVHRDDYMVYGYHIAHATANFMDEHYP